MMMFFHFSISFSHVSSIFAAQSPQIRSSASRKGSPNSNRTLSTLSLFEQPPNFVTFSLAQRAHSGTGAHFRNVTSKCSKTLTCDALHDNFRNSKSNRELFPTFRKMFSFFLILKKLKFFSLREHPYFLKSREITKISACAFFRYLLIFDEIFRQFRGFFSFET